MSRTLEKQISELKKFFNLAQTVFKQRAEGYSVVSIARRLSINADTCYKMVVLADPNRGITPAERKQMFHLMQKYDFLVTKRHIVLLLSVANRKNRNSLLVKTIKKHWSCQVLQTHIIAKQGRYRKLGRNPKIHGDPVTDLCRKLYSTGRYLESYEQVIPLQSIKRDLIKLKGLVAVLEKKCMKVACPPAKSPKNRK